MLAPVTIHSLSKTSPHAGRIGVGWRGHDGTERRDRMAAGLAVLLLPRRYDDLSPGLAADPAPGQRRSRQHPRPRPHLQLALPHAAAGEGPDHVALQLQVLAGGPPEPADWDVTVDSPPARVADPHRGPRRRQLRQHRHPAAVARGLIDSVPAMDWIDATSRVLGVLPPGSRSAQARRARSRRRWLGEHSGARRFPLAGGADVELKVGDWVQGTTLLTRRDSQPELLMFVTRRLAGGGTMIDVGAHIGLVTLTAARNPDVTVHAFEPDPANVVQFRRNLPLNPAARVELNEVAVGEEGRRGPPQRADPRPVQHRPHQRRGPARAAGRARRLRGRARHRARRRAQDGRRGLRVQRAAGRAPADRGAAGRRDHHRGARGVPRARRREPGRAGVAAGRLRPAAAAAGRPAPHPARREDRLRPRARSSRSEPRQRLCGWTSVLRKSRTSAASSAAPASAPGASADGSATLPSTAARSSCSFSASTTIPAPSSRRARCSWWSYGLADIDPARHHDRTVPAPAGQHGDRADPGVADDDARFAHAHGELVEVHEVDPLAPAVGQARRAVLDERVLALGEHGGRAHEAVEGLLVGPGGDEDHQSRKRLAWRTACGARGWRARATARTCEWPPARSCGRSARAPRCG